MLGALVSGCGSPPVSTASAVASWAKGAGLASTDALLATDVAEVGRGIAARLLGPTHTACDGLGADAGTAVGQLPTPDQRLTDELNGAYLTLARAAQDCSEAGSFGAAGFSRFERGAAAGMAGLRRAEARYRALVDPAGHVAGPARR